MLRIILFLLLAWLLISVIGLVIKGLFWLFVLGLVLFVATSALGWVKRSS